MGQPSRQGIALFSVRIEFWRSTTPSLPISRAPLDTFIFSRGISSSRRASLLAGGVETEVLHDDETVEGNKVPLRPAPVAGRRLEGEKLGSPAFGCDARPLGCNRVGGFTGEVPHDLPTDGRVRIEEPFEVRGSGCVIVSAHWSF